MSVRFARGSRRRISSRRMSGVIAAASASSLVASRLARSYCASAISSDTCAMPARCTTASILRRRGRQSTGRERSGSVAASIFAPDGMAETLRAAARTLIPALASARVRARPTKPLAPVTRTRIIRAFVRSASAASRREAFLPQGTRFRRRAYSVERRSAPVPRVRCSPRIPAPSPLSR